MGEPGDFASLRLCLASRDLQAALVEMAREVHAAGDPRYDPALEDVNAHLDRVEMFERGERLPPNCVQMSEYWLMNGGRMLGAIRIRYELNAFLLRDGGHIGYDIRPSEQRKGCATHMLGLGLEKLRRAGIERALLTTDPDNVASQRVILAHGGVRGGRSFSPASGNEMFQYWIEL